MTAREVNARTLAAKDGRDFNNLDPVAKNAYLHNADVEMARKPEGVVLADKTGMAAGGLIFSLVGKRKETSTDVLWNRVKKLAIAMLKFPHIVTMPCGRSARFDDAEHIRGLGIEDIKCMCGDPGHYIVRFQDLREDEIVASKGNRFCTTSFPE